jgi:hypothetical protein
VAAIGLEPGVPVVVPYGEGCDPTFTTGREPAIIRYGASRRMFLDLGDLCVERDYLFQVNQRPNRL